ncbi:MAG TPA: acyl-ACP--UDP-N-acetylglucosamine O-acyltransferase [Candidatus Paceibacterota bacterium]|nr:acyl-ACP--UDP-N-acetylglucosamine O-acyltransferase [Verrucomicrobiota bacterium]HSA11905.1 acyl-ACP--UDP-N-acetylglucosamine O-acyltransferase [Candidatus Paceibacterota bacterium]
MVHPTAIIHPQARIGADCDIGPYCLIGEHVELGPGCRLRSHVVIDGHTRLGRENEIYPFASIGLKTQDLKWKGGVTRTEIGDHNTIRECVTIHSATGDGEATVIGSHNNILASSHIGHNVVIGNRVIISMAALAGHVIVEDCALLGGLSAVHQFCRIGTMALIAGCAKVVQDVPPYMIVDGNPAEARAVNKVGLERNGVSEEAQAALRQAYKILIRDGLTTPNALARIESELPPLPEIKHLVQFVRASERGITKQEPGRNKAGKG